MLQPLQSSHRLFVRVPLTTARICAPARIIVYLTSCSVQILQRRCAQLQTVPTAASDVIRRMSADAVHVRVCIRLPYCGSGKGDRTALAISKRIDVVADYACYISAGDCVNASLGKGWR